jgi:hypothetical protein
MSNISKDMIFQETYNDYPNKQSYFFYDCGQLIIGLRTT